MNLKKDKSFSIRVPEVVSKLLQSNGTSVQRYFNAKIEKDGLILKAMQIEMERLEVNEKRRVRRNIDRGILK